MSDADIFKYIFNDDTKETIMNMTQFGIISFIPLVLLVKGLDIIPEASEKKGILENIFEIVLHLCVLIIGVVIISKFATYFKPLSGVAYPEFTLYPIVITVIILSLSFQTKISEKVFNVKEKLFKQTQNQPQSQPQSQLQSQLQSQPQSKSQSQSQTQVQNSLIQTIPTVQQLPNYNQMYENQPITDTSEPFAANLLGGSFGSNF